MTLLWNVNQNKAYNSLYKHMTMTFFGKSPVGYILLQAKIRKLLPNGVMTLDGHKTKLTNH